MMYWRPMTSQERIAGAGLLDPGQRVDDPEAVMCPASAHQSPPAAVGDDADLNVVLAQQRFHPVDGCRGPQIVGGLAQRVDRIDHDTPVHRCRRGRERGLRGDGDRRLGDWACMPGTCPQDSDSAQPATSRRTVSTHLSRATR